MPPSFLVLRMKGKERGGSPGFGQKNLVGSTGLSVVLDSAPDSLVLRLSVLLERSLDFLTTSRSISCKKRFFFLLQKF